MRCPPVALVPLALLAAPPARAQRQAFPDWGLAYTLPAGWTLAQQLGRVHGLTTGAQGAVIYVGAGMYQNFNEVAVDLGKGFQALGLTGLPVGQPQPSTIRGMQAMTATYAGQNQMGMPLQARVTAVLTPHGTGLIVTGIAAAPQMSQISQAVDRLAQSVEAVGAPQPNAQAVASLRGRWMFYAGRADGTTSASGGSSRSYEEFVEFDGQGRFVLAVFRVGERDDPRIHRVGGRRAGAERRGDVHGDRLHPGGARPARTDVLRGPDPRGSHHRGRPNLRAGQLARRRIAARAAGLPDREPHSARSGVPAFSTPSRSFHRPPLIIRGGGASMHELSLATEICRIAETHAGSRAPRVVAVGVEVGDEAGVEPESLAFCLEVLLGRPPFGRAAPRIARLPGPTLRVAYLEVDDDGADD